MRISNFAKSSFYLDRLIKKFSNDFGKDFYIIHSHWHELVGSEIAEQTYPLKIIKIKEQRTLQIKVESSSIATILEFGKTIIKDKINSMLDRKFIDNISFLYSKRGK
jgi:hypothetical protein